MHEDTIAVKALALRRKWLERWSFGLYITWRERRVALRTSRSSLRVYRELEVTSPDVQGVARYEEVVIRQTGFDRQRAREIVRLAEDSFAAWPNERSVNFRDVVQYLVVHECLKADPAALGIRAELPSFIAGLIPANL